MTFSLAAQQIRKTYGGVTALAAGNLAVQAGEVVALLGANGSGKSTLTKVITGVVTPDDGQLLLSDRSLRFASPQAAQKVGIVAVYQELSLLPDMTVAENIWLGHEPLQGLAIRQREVRQRTQALLDLFQGVISSALQPDVPVGVLPPDERQIVEILKALSFDPQLIILDEATASLDARQVERLFALVNKWKAQGKAIIFVSHRMEEIFQIADRAVVLRNGQTVGEVPIATTSEQALVELMVGQTAPVPTDLEAPAATTVQAQTRLQVDNLVTQRLRGISFAVQAGELLGIGGLQGQGQTDLLLALFGAQAFRGQILLDGAPVHFTHPRQAMQHAVAFVPGDRGAEGLLAIRSILENLQLPSWQRYGLPLRMGQARADAQRVGQDLRLVMSSLDAPVSTLSGGNAQKVVIGKWLLRHPTLLLLSDPTKGVDVSAKREFYALLRTLCQTGAAVILYSSEDEELLHLCNRVLVLRDGQLRAELTGDTLTKTNLVAASVGS